MFNDLIARVKEYAQQRRLEELTRKSKGDPMDIGQMQSSNCQHYHDQQFQYWPTADSNQFAYNHEAHLDALGKGKGGAKGKGKYGKAQGKGFSSVQCYVCGETGHMSYDCPKSKGKGKSNAGCWNCGQVGHQQWACPYPPKGKGKGKGKWGAKAGGKGAYAVEPEAPYWTTAWDQHNSDEPPADDEQVFGGGEIAEVQPWRVCVRRSRGARDMRPARTPIATSFNPSCRRRLQSSSSSSRSSNLSSSSSLQSISSNYNKY